jgi:hypothetical protein
MQKAACHRYNQVVADREHVRRQVEGVVLTAMAESEELMSDASAGSQRASTCLLLGKAVCLIELRDVPCRSHSVLS